jgi:hypothetical protein
MTKNPRIRQCTRLSRIIASLLLVLDVSAASRLGPWAHGPWVGAAAADSARATASSADAERSPQAIPTRKSSVASLGNWSDPASAGHDHRLCDAWWANRRPRPLYVELPASAAPERARPFRDDGRAIVAFVPWHTLGIRGPPDLG